MPETHATASCPNATLRARSRQGNDLGFSGCGVRKGHGFRKCLIERAARLDTSTTTRVQELSTFNFEPPTLAPARATMPRFPRRSLMRILTWMTALTFVLVTVAADAADKRAFEIADYYRTAFVGAPQLSPDGLRVAVAVTRYELEKGESWSEIWMVGAHGSRPRQMTTGASSRLLAGLFARRQEPGLRQRSSGRGAASSSSCRWTAARRGS